MKEEIFEMAFWDRKKKKDEQPLMPPPCRHRWKDFPWYINAEYFSGVDRFEFRVYEPYVCIYCKERQDKLIFEFISSISKKEADKYIEDFEENGYTDLSPLLTLLRESEEKFSIEEIADLMSIKIMAENGLMQDERTE